MAESRRPRKAMLSRCRPQTERCTLMFDIAGYSLLKGPGASKFIRSASVAVGGHDWCLRFYPNGDSDEVSQGYVSVFLELMSNTDGVMASFDIRLLNQATGVSIVLHNQMTPKLFEYANSNWGTKKLMKISELDASPYVQGDCLVIECDITVILGTPVSTSETMFDIQVPPSNLSDDLGKLLETGKMADVTFEVQGEVFHAHKFVLAMRSPVFEAELYGPMADKRRRSITVEDMQPGVFKALLHFIYKDLLPAMDDLDGEENEEMVKHLLAAADRYAMERMKLLCESILCRRLGVESVASTLAIADQHHCSELKDACIGFISSSGRMDDVVASKGYAHLKRSCPLVIAEIWEKSAKSRNI
ncbi:hypothetical protein ACP70R_003271 [Stipagrostis hirtigluma subsp. patula]